MNQYSLPQRLIHWVSAVTVLGLFALGFWMVDLDYYHEWYQTAPHWHQSIGIILMLISVIRIIFKVIQPTIPAIENHKAWEKLASKIVHGLMYIFLLTLFISGYFISTADGESIKVFEWFEIAAIVEFDDTKDWTGFVHKWVAYTLMAIVTFHVLGALKHHFIDKDETLLRMLGLSKK